MKHLCSSLGLAVLLLTVIVMPSHAAGDAVAGKTIFKRCQACHSTEPGKHKLGPSLAGLIGRKAGTEANYNFSSAMKKFGAIWTEKSLFEYLEAPRQVVKGTKMPFGGLKKPADRENVIAYLKQFSK